MSGPIRDQDGSCSVNSMTIIKEKSDKGAFMESDAHSLLSDLLCQARAAGADQADAVFVANTQIAVAQRLTRLERRERAESATLALRVILGRRQACVSSTDCDRSRFGDLAQRAVAMAQAGPEDPYCGLAPAELLTSKPVDLDLDEAREPSPEELVNRARVIEETALGVPGVTNSEGVEVEWSRAAKVLAASNGFCDHYTVSRHGVMVRVVAGQNTGMERDYELCFATHAEDLGDPVAIGQAAAQRAVERLNPRKVATCTAPVVFHPRVANSFLNHLAQGINGVAIARGTSFLKEKLGERIFPPGVSIIDDPLRRRGLRSRPYDAEALPCQKRTFVEEGILETWMLDLNSSRCLGFESTGHASRGVGSLPNPAPSNLYFTPGSQSPADLLANSNGGFYVTELMGSSVSMTSGDYSRGASGFWIEDGKLAYPVSELTIAGNLNDMFANLEVANDLTFRFGIDSPTLRIGSMTVAGS